MASYLQYTYCDEIVLYQLLYEYNAILCDIRKYVLGKGCTYIPIGSLTLYSALSHFSLILYIYIYFILIACNGVSGLLGKDLCQYQTSNQIKSNQTFENV